jgi:hypothetical protein
MAQKYVEKPPKLNSSMLLVVLGIGGMALLYWEDATLSREMILYEASH